MARGLLLLSSALPFPSARAIAGYLHSLHIWFALVQQSCRTDQVDDASKTGNQNGVKHSEIYLFDLIPLLPILKGQQIMTACLSMRH